MSAKPPGRWRGGLGRLGGRPLPWSRRVHEGLSRFLHFLRFAKGILVGILKKPIRQKGLSLFAGCPDQVAISKVKKKKIRPLL